MGFFRREQGQAGIEYLLVVGAVVVVMVTAMIIGFATLVPQIVGLACPSVDTAVDPAATVGSCLGP